MSNDNAWARAPTWGGQPGTFSAYQRRLATAFVRLKVGTLAELNTPGFPKPEAGTVEPLQQATGCAALLQSLGPLEDQVIAHHVAAQDGDDFEFEYADHDAIWAAIKLYSKGSLAALAGPDPGDQIAALAWPARHLIGARREHSGLAPATARAQRHTPWRRPWNTPSYCWIEGAPGQHIGNNITYSVIASTM